MLTEKGRYSSDTQTGRATSVAPEVCNSLYFLPCTGATEVARPVAVVFKHLASGCSSGSNFTGYASYWSSSPNANNSNNAWNVNFNNGNDNANNKNNNRYVRLVRSGE